MYSGTALLLIAVLTGFLGDAVSVRRIRNVLAWLGLILIVMSATPLPWAGVIVFFLFFGLWYLAGNSTYAAKFRVGSAIALVALIVCMCAMEYPFRRLPDLKRPPGDRITIVGDSISAGIDSHVPTWPLFLQEKTGLRVRNLSVAGATTTDAIKMAQQLADKDRLVLIEIGAGMICSQGDQWTNSRDR